MNERYFNSLSSFSRYTEALAVEIPERCYIAAFYSTGLIKESVDKTFGDKTVLAPLADSTIELRTDGGDTPLLIDGSLLKDSIEAKSMPLGDGAIGGVGSPEKLLLQHERGYITASNSMIPNKVVPPRPVFTVGVMRAMPAVRELCVNLLTRGVRLFNAKGRFTSFKNPASAMINPGNLSDAIGEI